MSGILKRAADTGRLAHCATLGQVPATRPVQYGRTFFFVPAAAINVARSAPLMTDGQPFPAATTERHKSAKLGDALAAGLFAGAADGDVTGEAAPPEPGPADAEPPAATAPLDAGPWAVLMADSGSVGARPVPVAEPATGATLDVAAWPVPYGWMAVRGWPGCAPPRSNTATAVATSAATASIDPMIIAMRLRRF
jgi:hypothetical protein